MLTCCPFMSFRWCMARNSSAEHSGGSFSTTRGSTPHRQLSILSPSVRLGFLVGFLVPCCRCRDGIALAVFGSQF